MTSLQGSFRTFTMIIAFLLGTSIIFGTPRLVPDIWLVDIVSLVPSSMLFLFYIYLVKSAKGREFFPLLSYAWGRIAGSVLILVYVVYFIYLASRNLRDLIELIMTSLLNYTPNEVLISSFLILIAYAVTGNLSTISRLSVPVVFMVLLFFTLLGLMLAFSGTLKPEHYFPVLTEGFPKVVGASFKSSIWIPYGEIIVFLVFYKQLGGIQPFRKTGLISIISAGVLLTISSLLQIGALGMEGIRFSLFGILDAARLINISDFITRMDALVAIIIFFGVLLKCSIFIYAATKGAEYVFNKANNHFVLPCVLLIGGFSILVTENYAEHVDEGLKMVPYLLHLPMQLAVPAGTLLLCWIRRLKGEAQ